MRTQSLVLKSRPVFTDERRFFYKGKKRSKGPKTKTLVEEENTSSVSLEKDTPKKKSKSRNREKKQLREVFTKKEELSEEISGKMQKHKKKHKKKEELSSEMMKKKQSNLPKRVELSKANQEFYKERQWPGGLVPYVIQDLKGFDLEDMRGRLKEVNDILKAKTCVKTQEMTEKEAEGYEDYLLLDTSPDYVTGRVGGRQVAIITPSP
ncbi:hypothetical protein K1T71_014886 [Dendrolimus kikuchii]|nr:hypothetical protein K1T71_014886 [Dendrolimus kikuchii]